MYKLCMWLNALPIRSGITGEISPRELVTGLTITFIKHYKFDVGAYTEASTNTVITNDNTAGTHPCPCIFFRSLRRQTAGRDHLTAINLLAHICARIYRISVVGYLPDR